MKTCRSSGPPKSLPHGGRGRRAALFFGIITTVGTVIEEGAAGQRIPTVEGMQRLANRPRGRIRFSTNRLVSVANENPVTVVVLLGRAARSIMWDPIAVASALLSSGQPFAREARHRHRPETAASFAPETESRGRGRPADIAAHG